MSDLLSQFNDFTETITTEEGGKNDTKIDYDAHIAALNEYAAKVLSLPPEAKVDLKPVYLHKTKIHSLLYNVCLNGRRYSARLVRRISLCIREADKGRWEKMVKKAHEIAMDLPPVGLDPRLEESPYWVSSNGNKSRMEFKKGESTLTLSPIKINNGKGTREDLISIIEDLNKRGLE